MAMTMVQKLRRMNLKRLVEEMFEGNASEAGRKLSTSHTYMWQILSGHRGIGERSARDIEAKLKLQPFDLDREHGETAPPARLSKVPVRSLDAIEGKPVDHCICPLPDAAADMFAVVADGDTEATMSEFAEGDVVFIEPLAKPRGKGLYLVARGARARLLQARADGDGGFEFYTTLKPARRVDGAHKVLGRVTVVTRSFA